MPPKPTALRLNSETKDRLEKLGRLQDRSPHYLMVKAIELYLDQEEALQAEIELTRARWQKYELTGEAISHDDMKVWASGIGTAEPENEG